MYVYGVAGFYDNSRPALTKRLFVMLFNLFILVGKFIYLIIYLF